MSQGEKKQIGRILLQQRAINAQQLERALADRSQGGRLASRLAQQGTISDIEALKALSEQHGIPGIDLQQICLRLEDLDLIPREIAEKHLILPVLAKDDRLFIALANPREKNVIDEIEFVTGKKVYPYVALEGVLSRVIDSAYARKSKGAAYYVGANCPAGVLLRLGIDRDGQPLADGVDSIPAGASLSAETPESEAPAVVVDDAVGRMSRADNVEDSDFGATSRDLSVVTDLPEGSQVELGAPTILVVDDEADIRKLLKRLLNTRGYRVLEADRGLLALRMVKEHAPDLIVLDAMLPEVHGFDIARRMKGSSRYGHIPIIMVSAVYRGWRYAEDLKASCGVDHYIEKPFRIADVLRAVEDCLEQGSKREPREPPAELSSQAEEALNMGVAAYKAGRVDEAIEHLKAGIGIDPLAYRLHFHLGLLYGKQNRVYEAIAQLETAFEINSRHFPAVKNLAILYQKAGFRHKATEMWHRALSTAPDEATRQSIRQHLLQLL